MPRSGRLTEKEFFSLSNWYGYGGPIFVYKEGTVVISDGRVVLSLKREHLPKAFIGYMPAPMKVHGQSVKPKDAQKILYPVVSEWLTKEMEELVEIKLGTSAVILKDLPSSRSGKEGYCLLTDDKGFQIAAVSAVYFRIIRSLYCRLGGGTIRYYTPRLPPAAYADGMIKRGEHYKWLSEPIYIAIDQELVAILMPIRLDLLDLPVGSAGSLMDLAALGRTSRLPTEKEVAEAKEAGHAGP